MTDREPSVAIGIENNPRFAVPCLRHYAKSKYQQYGGACLVLTEGQIRRRGQTGFRGARPETVVHRLNGTSSLRRRDLSDSAGESGLSLSYPQHAVGVLSHHLR